MLPSRSAANARSTVSSSVAARIAFTARVASGAAASISAASARASSSRLLALDDAVDDAPARGLGRVDRPAGEQQLARQRRRHPAREPEDPARVGDEPDLHLGQREARVGDGDDQVAGERELEPAPGRVAVDRGDHRLVEVEELGQPGEPARAERLGVAGIAGRVRLQVPAGGEEALAGAGDDRDPQLRVVAEGDERLAHRPAGRRVDRVRLRPVDRQLERRAAPLRS